MRPFRVVLSATILSIVFAFTPVRTRSPQFRRLAVTSLFAGPQREGGGAIATPETKTITKTKTETKTNEKIAQKRITKSQEPDEELEFKEAPLWLLFLLGDEEYEQGHVSERLCQIIEDVNEKYAIDLYEAAQRLGEALCGKYPKEIAELYAEQLTRSDPIIYAEVRPDKTED